MEVAGRLVKKDKGWKQEVMEAMEDCFKKRESEVGLYDRERRREEVLFGGWDGRREDSRDRKMERKESRVCHACGEQGHIRKDCGRFKKDRKF